MAAASSHRQSCANVLASRSPGSEWINMPTRLIDRLPGFAPVARPPRTNAYGGDPSRATTATGFFRAVETNGKWWLVDPEGCLFFCIGVCAVVPSKTPGAIDAFNAKFGTDEKWARETAALLRRNGFNSTGAWCAEALHNLERPLVYAPILNMMSRYGHKRGGAYAVPGHTGYPNDAIFVFDPEFEPFCKALALEECAGRKNDPWLLGWFTDNEMPLHKTTLDGFLKLPETDHGGRAARDWLRARRGSNATPAEISDADRLAFLELVTDRYFSITAKAIKAADPNHMVIGSRFYGDEKNIAQVFRAAGRHLDVISSNIYFFWQPDPAMLAMWTAESGKPFLVTEFYAKGEDSGLPNTTGGGWLVKTQDDRGKFYETFCLGLLESKGCVGWHYFKYMDCDVKDPNAEMSNRDANKGLVSVEYGEWTGMTARMKRLNRNAWALIDYFHGPQKAV